MPKREMTLTEANTRAWLAICSCGWTSDVCKVAATQRPKADGSRDGRKVWHDEEAKERARDAFKKHKCLPALSLAASQETP